MPAQIPENVDPKGTYMLSGVFINRILDCLRENVIVLDQSGPLKIINKGPDGTKLGLDTDTCPS